MVGYHANVENNIFDFFMNCTLNEAINFAYKYFNDGGKNNVIITSFDDYSSYELIVHNANRISFKTLEDTIKDWDKEIMKLHFKNRLDKMRKEFAIEETYYLNNNNKNKNFIYCAYEVVG